MIGIEVYENQIGQCRGHVGGVQTGPCYCRNEWRFRVRARNGEIVAASEGYATKAAAEKGVRALRRALLPGTRDAEALHTAWVRGFMRSHDMERGYSGEPGDAPVIPDHLVEELKKWSPYWKET